MLHNPPVLRERVGVRVFLIADFGLRIADWNAKKPSPLPSPGIPGEGERFACNCPGARTPCQQSPSAWKLLTRYSARSSLMDLLPVFEVAMKPVSRHLALRRLDPQGLIKFGCLLLLLSAAARAQSGATVFAVA